MARKSNPVLHFLPYLCATVLYQGIVARATKVSRHLAVDTTLQNRAHLTSSSVHTCTYSHDTSTSQHRKLRPRYHSPHHQPLHYDGAHVL